MRIAILGGGTVGGGLAQRWTREGHDVTVVPRTEGVPPDAEVVLLAVPAGVATEVVAARAHELDGMVLLDATNDVSATLGTVADRVAAAAPGARVVKAFNTVFAAIYDEVDAHRGVADMAYCGDDAAAKDVAATLITDAGFRPLDCGGLEAAGDLEGFARMVIRTAYRVGRGPFAYRVGAPGALAGRG